MGSPVSEAERSYHEQQHIVLLTRDFWITQTEVTIAQWEQVMGTTTVDICQGDDLPSAATSKHEPMRCVSWCDAALPNMLSAITLQTYSDFYDNFYALQF